MTKSNGSTKTELKPRRTSTTHARKSSESHSSNTEFPTTHKRTSAWVGELSSQADSLEQAAYRVVCAQPLVTAGVAVGVGFIANLIWQQYSQPTTKGRRATKHVSTGILAKNISSSLSRYESEFNSLALGEFDEMRNGLGRLVVDDLERHPFETLATAVGIGFGLANFDRRHFKQAGLKIFKIAALNMTAHLTNGTNENQSTTGGSLYV